MFWWGLVAVVLVLPFALYGFYAWASKDPGVNREIAKEQFRAEQERRWLRRSGKGD